ncbi:MAG: methyltransferase domain-containing protein [Deltaproteobacteria bacterium]|nr:methyltransferase domain-containing protein [Deltaproteobacteria bacterium]
MTVSRDEAPARAWDLLRNQALVCLDRPAAAVLPDDVLDRLATALDRLRQPLLRGTPGGPYLDEPLAQAAYAVGLAPRTTAAVLHELPGGAPARVLDVGAGLGAAALAAVLRGARRVTLIDQDGAALERARDVLTAAGAERVDLRRTTLAQPPGDVGTFDLVLAGFSLVEASADDPARAGALLGWMADRVAPGGWLLVVDSAQKSRARLLNGLRETLLAASLHLWGPCPHALPCPALVRERDFCHAARRWELPADFARLGELAGVHRTRLSYAFLLAGRDPPPSTAPSLRVIGDVQREKGRARVMVCSAGPARELVALARHRDAHAALEALQRGDAVDVEVPPDAGALLRVETAVHARGAP